MDEPLTPASEAESVWVEEVTCFVREQVCPVMRGPAPLAAETGASSDQNVTRLRVFVVKTIQAISSASHTLPISYRLVSVSELLSRQHLACVSNLSWSSSQQRAWAREAELGGGGQRALPRVNLLLVGCLREERGEWRLTDASGSVRCEVGRGGGDVVFDQVLSLSPQWLNRLVFLPHWNYIPHNAAEQQEPGGFVELVGPPVPLCDGEEEPAAGSAGGAEPHGAVGVREAVDLLNKKVRGRRVSVCGRVSSVCPLLVISGMTFFCFSLTDDTHTLPVLVKDGSRLLWSRCVCVGQSVCVTALRVCVLRGWRGNNVLCVTGHSEILDAPVEAQSHTPPPTMTSHADDGDDAPEGAEPLRHIVQPAVRSKQSRIISYQGTVTKVVSEGAGLYVMDSAVGLCLAYQPTLRRKLRAGDGVEVVTLLHHVHFLFRPCADFLPSVLCTCLRSSLRVTTFSRLLPSPADSCCPGDGVLPRLLLEENMGVSEYLWACHLSSQLRRSLRPSLLKPQCVCLLSWKLKECVSGRETRRRRDIYSEMLDEPHTCPLTQYTVDPALPQLVTVADVRRSLQSDSWSSVCLSSLLPPAGSGMSSAQINSSLSWSSRTLTSDPESTADPRETLRRRPLLLVGVLELPSPTCEPTLQLRDGTGAIACVVTETSQEEDRRQTAAFNTAWIGCLVCVQRFTMVTERFLQSNFPSYQHLSQEKFITHQQYRVYLQFSLDHIYILSASVPMATAREQRGEESGGQVNQCEEEDEGQIANRKRKRQEEQPDTSLHPPSVTMTTTRPCVSMVIRVEQKEGVAWTNTGVGLKEGQAGLTPCFSVKAMIGPVVSWGRDPRNRPMTDDETESEEERKVTLVCSGASVRWFPILQPGCFYRLIAPHTQDPSVFIGCSVSKRSGMELHAEPTLQVPSDWRFHTLTRPLPLHTCRQTVSTKVLSVAQVLDDSCTDLVCFQGLVSERISLNDRTGDTGHTHTGVRLTLCDESGRSLQVYLDLSHTPYLPGLLPGNTLLLSSFLRRLSRCAVVYCSNLPVSSVTVVSLSSTAPPPPPIMHLGLWAFSSRCTVGRVKGHVVCLLLLQLQWKCSVCESVYTQSTCSPGCLSSSPVFQSKAKLVIDDGTGEAHVWFSGELVHSLLGLAHSQWAGLQRAVKTRGPIRVYPRGRSLVCDSDSSDSLLDFLLCVCGSGTVCRVLSLTCRKHSNQKQEEMRQFSRGDRDFLTRMTRPLQLTCLHIH